MPIFVGIDVAKETHWVCARGQDARVVLDRTVANDQAALDVTVSIASFLEAVLLAEGFALVHVPRIAVNRGGHGFAGGERKSDPKDARTSPSSPVRARFAADQIRRDGETTVAIHLKVARRHDLVQYPVGALIQSLPGMGAVLGPRSRAPSMPASGARANATTRPSSPWHAGGLRSSGP